MDEEIAPCPTKGPMKSSLVKEIAPCPFESKTFDEVCEVHKEKALALKIWKLKGVTWVVKWMLEGNWKKNLKCWKGIVGH